MKPETGSNAVSGSSPRRNSSGESHVTGQSDPKKWFDLSNSNAPAAFDHATMDGAYTAHLKMWLLSLADWHLYSRPSLLSETVRLIQRRNAAACS